MQKQQPYRQRLDALFTDLGKLASISPLESGSSPDIQVQLDALAERLQALEAEIAAANPQEKGSSNGLQHQHTNMLYEQENLGYIYSGEAVKSLHGNEDATPNGNTLKAPLSVSGDVIGQIQVSAESEREWASDEVNLANTIAQQAALQIQSLRLLAATEKARNEAESATRQFIHHGWEAYLDAINEKERIGYVYDQESVTPLQDNELKADYKESVTVMGENIGNLQLKTEHPLNDSDKLLISSVAKQIGQQVENLRLLADASRARAEAEESARSLAHDNWKAYMEKQGEGARSFLYDTVEVRAVQETELPHNISLTQPLIIQGETIGQLAVSGLKNVSPESASLAKTIAAQASIHLETLRLNEELKRRAAELQELDRLKSAFLANMSHELRTPLNSILGFADVMLEELDGPLTENMESDLKLIQKNGQHLLHLINDVLDMAKIESGKMNLILERFNVHEIMQDVISITSSLANAKGLSLHIETDSDDMAGINADRTRMRQVLINVVNNAIKFTEMGGITLRVDGKEDNNLLIRVRDTGIGIPPQNLEDIFKEFTQVDTSTTRKVGGTGLGLPISRRLIEMHGGRLWAESSGINGEGTTFYIFMPVEANVKEEETSEPLTKK